MKVGNIDITDYAKLGHNVEILSEVLTNVHLFVAVEKSLGDDADVPMGSQSVTSNSLSPKKSGTTPQTRLEVIADLLQKLSGRIGMPFSCPPSRTLVLILRSFVV